MKGLKDLSMARAARVMFPCFASAWPPLNP